MVHMQVVVVHKQVFVAAELGKTVVELGMAAVAEVYIAAAVHIDFVKVPACLDNPKKTLENLVDLSMVAYKEPEGAQVVKQLGSEPTVQEN